MDFIFQNRRRMYAKIASAIIAGALGLWCACSCRADAQKAAVPPAAESSPVSLEMLKSVGKGKPESGAGIIIFGPVPGVGMRSEDVTFGLGCGDWLYLTVGGQPGLGQTPLFTSVFRARRELKFENFHIRLMYPEALRAARITGATHFAVGSFTSDSGIYKLSYTVYRTNKGDAIASPFVATGDREKIRGALPQMGVDISKALGLTTPSIPQTVDASVDDLVASGGMLWRAPNGDDFHTAQRLADHEIIADSYLLLNGTWRGENSYSGAVADTDANAAAINNALRQMPENQLFWVMAAYLQTETLKPRLDDLDKLRARYPGSYPLAEAAAFAAGNSGLYSKAANLSLREVQNAPNNPDAWLRTGAALTNQAGNVRQSRVAAEIDEKEWNRLNTLYPAVEFCHNQVVRLDPQSEYGWIELAGSATFAGDTDVALSAFAKAETYTTDAYRLYWWGLEMFQSKWGGSPANLAKVGRLAAAAEYGNPRSAEGIVTELFAAALPDRAHELGDRYVKRLDDQIHSNPQDGTDHALKAELLETMKEDSAACAEWKIAAQDLPNVYNVRTRYGTSLQKKNDYALSVPEFRAAVAMEPENSMGLLGLGWGLLYTDHLDEAETTLRHVITRSPRWSGPHSALEMVYLREKQPQKAIDDCKSTIDQGIADHDTYENMIQACCAAERPEEAIHWGEIAIDIYTRKAMFDKPMSILRTKVGYAYGQAHRYKESVAQNEIAIALDPSNVRAHLYLGAAENHLDQRAAARREWALVVKAGTDSEAATQAAQLLEKYPEKAK